MHMLKFKTEQYSFQKKRKERQTPNHTRKEDFLETKKRYVSMKK